MVARVRIFCDMNLNGSAWFDDVRLIEGPLPTGLAEIILQEILLHDGSQGR